MALAAALEDQANPEALYVVYMKLAEIHCNHMPDAQLCQVYRDRAQSLKRVLAGEDGAAEKNMEDAETQSGRQDEEEANADKERTESAVKRNSIIMSTPEKCEDNFFPRTCTIHGDTEDRCSDTNGKIEHSIDSGSLLMNAFGSETETIGSQSYSDSVLTESFDTAKEQISDSSSSTGTLQTNRNQTDEKDFDTDHFMPSQTPEDPTSDITTHINAQNTDSDIQNEKNTTAKETDVHAEKYVSVEGNWCDTD